MKLKNTGRQLRRVACAVATGGMLAWSAPALAQDEVEGEAEAPVAEDVEGQAPAPAAERRAKPAGSSGEAPPQITEIHQVNRGDTLWDLTTKYLNSPWYWPKIWSYNPQITNPHWIYPGNELRFYPSDEALPTAVEVSRMITAPEDEDAATSPMVADDVVSSAGKFGGQRVVRNSVYRSHVAFIDNEEHGKAGTIENSRSEAFMLDDYDKVFVKAKDGAKPGDRFAVYRTVKEIEHPITGEPFGYSVEVLGTLRIESLGQSLATAVIEKAYRPIERGDWVGPIPEFVGQRVSPEPNSGAAKGYIIETMEAAQSEIGEHSIVFIDRGRSHGVKTGNVFTAIQRGDRFTGDEEGLPYEDVGELLVIDARENVSTAIVIRSVQEIAVGDKVELRSGG
jgi:hypothetical protein